MLKELRLGPDGFSTSDANEADVREVLFAGRWVTTFIPDSPKALHVLDLEPDEGAFACWAFMHFGGPWIDCLVNPDAKAEETQAIRRNMPPSARFVETVSPRTAYDAVHAGSHVEAGLEVLRRCKPSWYGAEWDTHGDRLLIDQACAAVGLRMFRVELRDANVGRALWLRSNAVWVDGQYRLRAA